MGYSMVDITSYILIGIACFCFGLIVSSRIAPIQYLPEANASCATLHFNEDHRAGACGV